MAVANEEVKNVKGETLFEVDDTVSKIKAPIFGIWAIEGGKEYWETPSKNERTYNKIKTLSGEEREKTYNDLTKAEQTQVEYLFKEDKYSLPDKLRDLRNKSVDERADGIIKYLRTKSRSDKIKLSEQLEDVGIMTKAVKEKVMNYK